MNRVTSTEWWGGACSKTELSKLAVSVLNLPASSAATERSFKTYSWLHNNKTNRLTNERAAKRVYIAHNYKLFKEKNKESESESETDSEYECEENEGTNDAENTFNISLESNLDVAVGTYYLNDNGSLELA